MFMLTHVTKQWPTSSGMVSYFSSSRRNTSLWKSCISSMLPNMTSSLPCRGGGILVPPERISSKKNFMHVSRSLTYVRSVCNSSAIMNLNKKTKLHLSQPLFAAFTLTKTWWFQSPQYIQKGTAVAQWLRCCATNRNVVGLIPAGVIGIFHWHNPSDCTMALGSTQPLKEMSTRSISWGWRRPVRKADNLITTLCHCHEIWET